MQEFSRREQHPLGSVLPDWTITIRLKKTVPRLVTLRAEPGISVARVSRTALNRAAITLQSVSAPYHVPSCTLNAVRALYVLETTFYDGFESHSPAPIKAGFDFRLVDIAGQALPTLRGC